MKNALMVLLLIITPILHAQKVVEKSIDVSSISTIYIEGDKFFKIEVKTAKTNIVKLQTNIEGEYAEHMVVSTETKNDSLIISGVFQPLFKKYNDKLSAHKALSVEVQLIVPEHLNLYIRSAIASAEIKGNYNNLTLELNQGNCSILSFSGNALINSVNGNIAIATNYASCKANTKTGTITREELTLGNNKIRLNSINGNIRITKS